MSAKFQRVRARTFARPATVNITARPVIKSCRVQRSVTPPPQAKTKTKNNRPALEQGTGHAQRRAKNVDKEKKPSAKSTYSKQKTQKGINCMKTIDKILYCALLGGLYLVLALILKAAITL